MNSDNIIQYSHKANPDDPPVTPSPRGPKGALPGPNYLGLFLKSALALNPTAVILIAQLLIITDALYELLSGRRGSLPWLALVSFIGFAIALLVALWPRRRIEE